MKALAEFTDYDGMLEAIRARARQLQIKGRGSFDVFAGLPDGYLDKLIGARPQRRIGMTSMGPLFEALGVYCVMFEDKEATKRLKSRVKPRQSSFVRATRTYYAMTDKRWAKIQALGSKARWQNFSKHQRTAIMRALANKRWRSP